MENKETKEKQIAETETIEDEIQLLKEINKNIIRSKLTPFDSFKNGILSGLGAVLGATVVLAILIGLLGQLVSVPVIGDFVKQIVDVVQKK